MKPWKLKGALLLAVILVLAYAAATTGAILQTGGQLINLVSPTGNSGLFAFKDMLMKDINGNPVPFSIPAGQVLVITRVGWNLTANNSSLTETVQLTVGNYWRVGARMTNGFASAGDVVNPGIAVTESAASIYVSDLNNIQTFIPGDLSLRIVGYLAPNR